VLTNIVLCSTLEGSVIFLLTLRLVPGCPVTYWRCISGNNLVSYFFVVYEIYNLILFFMTKCEFRQAISSMSSVSYVKYMYK